MQERLQKYLAGAGVASRRKAEELILQGRVKVNGEVVTELGVKVDPDIDTISVDDNEINTKEKKIYLMLNKPAGYLTTVKDDFGRPTVMDLIKRVSQRIFPVGRLDLDTEGLLLMTNDGDFAYLLTHPKHEKTKTYQALVMGSVSEEELDKLRQGVELEDGLTSPAQCKIMKRYIDKTLTEITIHEGRKRQVRRMFTHIGHKVVKLTRTAEDFLTLGNLRTGRYRFLTDEEIKRLKEE